MGTIIKKKIKGIDYYYYVESKRVDGRSKYVNQKHLGSADKLLKMGNESGKSLQEQILYALEVTFGSVALLYDIAMRLDIVSIIDEVVPKRNQGASVGMYILTAAINRAVSPTSTNGLKRWYVKTSLPHMTGLMSTLFTPQNFWNNTDITVEQLKLRYRAIVGKDAQITIVFERGNDSKSNLDLFEGEGLVFHYVGGLFLGCWGQK